METDQPVEAAAPDAPEVPDTPTAEAPAPPSPGEETSAEAPEAEAPDLFEDNFDPKTLPAELKPAYDQMRAAFTKKTMTLAEQRKELENTAQAAEFLQKLQSDPDTQKALLRELAEAHGYELPDEEDPDAEEEPTGPETVEERLERLEGERQAEREAAEAAAAQKAQDDQLAAIDTHVSEKVAAIAKAEDRVISEDEESIIISHAVSAFPPGKDGMPQVDAAYKALSGLWNARQKAWLESKHGATTPPTGQPGQQQRNLDNEEERVAHMAEIIDAARAAS